MTGDSNTLAQGHAKFLEGWAQHQQGAVGKAWALYQEAIALHPSHFDALHLAGIVAAQGRLFDQAIALIGRALQVDPNNAPAHFNLGNVLADAGQTEAAVASYDRAIALDAAAAEPHNNRGNALLTLKRAAEAVAGFDRAIALKPDYFEAHNNRGNALRDLGQPEAALQSFANAIALRADFPEVHNNRGNVLRDLGRHQEALESYDSALRLRPAFAEAHNNRGNTLLKLHRVPDAIASYQQALVLKPDYVDAMCNLGWVQRIAGQRDAARETYARAIALNEGRADAHYGLGLAHTDGKEFEAAIIAHDKATAINPTYAEAHNNRGIALAHLKRHREALEAYDRAVALKPDYAEAYNNRGATLKELKQTDAALASYTRSITLQPKAAEAYNNRGILLAELQRYDDAIADYQRALDLRPDYPFLRGAAMHARMHICDWQNYGENLAALLARVERGEQVASPFHVLALSDDQALHRKAAEAWSAADFPFDPALGALPALPDRGKRRVGYFSMDYRAHPTAQLVLGVLEAHDRDRFEIFAFSYGPDTGDALRLRSQNAVDHFIDVREKSDREIAALTRSLGIDIAVDLAGYTALSRTGIFAFRAAPIQINFLGYPGTMGSDYYDYVVADHTVVTDAQRPHFKEKIVRLPHCYQPNDATRAVSEREFARAELGLPAEGFVFCCLNNNFKITPPVFDAWARILKRVDGSVLWLLEDNADAARNLRREAARRGIAPERLVFAGRIGQGDHLARHRAGDLFLDTHPYNAHTTASDALWMGLPVLTYPGKSLPSRVAASILRAAGLPELIAATPGEYEARAVELAHDPEQLLYIKQKLARNRLTRPLYDAKLFARHLEAAYARMAELARQGLPADHIDVMP